ncbi:MAG: radical SAM protein [Acidobacteriota bacterium]|nr:radical SAM protein [Acidobacteriota bacterium]
MKRVLLLNPPGDKLYLRDMYCSSVSKANYSWPPIDLLIQSGIIGRSRDVDVLDAQAEGLSARQSREKIRKGRYEAILFLTSTASWRQDFAFIQKVKEDAKFPLLLIGNGDILLYEPERFLRDFPCLDAAMFDYTNSDVVHYLDGETDKIRSMAFRTAAGMEIRREKILPREFAYPVPHHEKFPLRKYLLAHGKRFPFTTVQMSFGCPFRCSFCIAATLGYKYRALDNVLDELRRVVSLRIKEVFFSDFTFEAKRKNAMELCRRMAEEKLDLSWTCSSRANTLDRELLIRMKRAGCHTILIGVESGNASLLKQYSKGVTKDDMRRAFSQCREIGIRTLGHFIIGLPGETEFTVQETIRFSKELDCDLASFNIAVPALGTPLRDQALKNRWLHGDALEFDASGSFPVIETPDFSKAHALFWQRRAIQEFYSRPTRLARHALAAGSLYQWRILIRNGWALFRDFLRNRISRRRN